MKSETKRTYLSIDTYFNVLAVSICMLTVQEN